MHIKKNTFFNKCFWDVNSKFEVHFFGWNRKGISDLDSAGDKLPNNISWIRKIPVAPIFSVANPEYH